ncbi:hypothetical protein PHSY_007277 [Pseudozyma hubeiensis SY62]|uniref:Uncharacterized protein n=1 Tax=Pseudozyma hubeiensis (strain SY62) TaxID=1305764 RepID=R9PE81_PSEHS|nr:hypothetical protein PHSY_007277 [Pseudozyma hubeiensis SY62]GAC99674.1 hypothetical protein PHSY_007277 [Pseudozyma hubeiensis SY62]
MVATAANGNLRLRETCPRTPALQGRRACRICSGFPCGLGVGIRSYPIILQYYSLSSVEHSGTRIHERRQRATYQVMFERQNGEQSNHEFEHNTAALKFRKTVYGNADRAFGILEHHVI